MRNRLGKSLSVLLLAASPALQANDIEPGKETYSVVYAPKPIVVDGDLAEWSGVPVLADPKFAVPKGTGGGAAPNYVLFEEYAGGTWSGPDDQTSAVQITYDTDNVYFGFVVTDDYHENSANSAWNGDSVQLMIANGDRTQQVALYNYALGGVEDALGEVIVMHEAGPAVDDACGCATEAVITRNPATKKTTYEIKLPKASLGLATLKGGPQFGLGMAINDGDAGPGQAGQKGWGGLGAHALVFGKSPSETAEVTLQKGNDIEPGKEFYTALRSTKPIVLDGALSEWSGVPVLSDPKFAVPKFSGTNDNPNYVLFEEYSGGTWTGPDDQTSAVQITYDPENVYFAFVVTDDYHENSANSAWNGDSVQLMIASADRTQQVALYNYALGGVEDALGEVIIMHEAGPAVDDACGCATEAIITRNPVTKKTSYEIKLPAAALSLTPPLAVGLKFGLGMAINDGDSGPGQAGQKGWGGLGAHALVFGKSPAETAEVTLGTTASGSDRFFLSAINPSILTFTFRASDKGASVVNPASAKLFIDSQAVTLVASPKSGDATDFAHTRTTQFPAGNHAYRIEIADNLGNVVVDSGTFLSKEIPVLGAAQRAASVDQSKPGFQFNVFQNELVTSTALADAELALRGQLSIDGSVVPNLAEPNNSGVADAVGVTAGPVVKFAIPGTINLSQIDQDVTGSFTPDSQMPGIPGTSGLDDGIVGEIVAFVELPAGLVTLGVNSEDGFRTQAGYLNTADATLLGEFDGARGPTDSPLRFIVETAGIYPIRTIWMAADGGANIELFSVKSDGAKVLLNDLENGGWKTFRTGVVPTKPVNSNFSVTVKKTGAQVEIAWSEPGVKLQESTDLTAWTDLAATSPHRPTGSRTAVFYRLKK